MVFIFKVSGHTTLVQENLSPQYKDNYKDAPNHFILETYYLVHFISGEKTNEKLKNVDSIKKSFDARLKERDILQKLFRLKY